MRLGILAQDHAPVALHLDDPVPGERDIGNIVVRAGQTLRGRVRRSDGSTAAGAWVGALDPEVGQVVRQGMTGADGRFEFLHLGPGPLEISAMDSPVGPFAGAEAKASGVHADGQEVVLILSTGRGILVSVIDAATGQPLKSDFVVVSVRAEASLTEPYSTTLFDTRSGTTAVRVRTDRTGPHLLKVRVRGFREWGPERIDTRDDGEIKVRAELVLETD
jgi:hypothetical protein